MLGKTVVHDQRWMTLAGYSGNADNGVGSGGGGASARARVCVCVCCVCVCVCVDGVFW